MALEHGHHQSQRLVLGEDDWWQSHSPAEPVAAVPAARGLDGHPGLSQDRDVPACRASCDPEALSDLVGGRAGLDLQDLECLQRASRGADPRCHAMTVGESPVNPEANRPVMPLRSKPDGFAGPAWCWSQRAACPAGNLYAP